MTKEKPLPAKQQLFVATYLANGYNATQAAITAGYSKKTAEAQASRLLTNVKVKAAVEAGKAEVLDDTIVDAKWLHKRLAEEAEADIADLYDEEGHLKPVHEWPKIWRQGLIQGLDVESLFEGRGESREYVGKVLKIKMADRAKRLEMLGKHVNVNAFQENVNHTGLEGGEMSETEKAARIAALLAKALK